MANSEFVVAVILPRTTDAPHLSASTIRRRQRAYRGATITIRRLLAGKYRTARWL